MPARATLDTLDSCAVVVGLVGPGSPDVENGEAPARCQPAAGSRSELSCPKGNIKSSNKDAVTHPARQPSPSATTRQSTSTTAAPIPVRCIGSLNDRVNPLPTTKKEGEKGKKKKKKKKRKRKVLFLRYNSSYN
jgi:hypothetical protein